MTSGNYATAQKHHTSHLWCADTAVESDPGLTHSKKKGKKKKKHKWPPPPELPPGTSLKGGMREKKNMGQERTGVKKDTYGISSEEGRGSSVSVITALPCPADLQDKVRGHKWKDQN